MVALLHAYLESPAVWTDDFNIPESGNGIPDIIDEIKWGFDWLKKMQNTNGAVLSIVGLSHNNSANQHASPPSTATGASYYGPVSTSATLTSAGAFALGSKVFAALDDEVMKTYAEDSKVRAENAWAWSIANPNVTFRNNEGESAGLGAGQQEVDDKTRATKKLTTAIYLFAATGSTSYRDYVDANSNNATSWVAPWMYYATCPMQPSVSPTMSKTNINPHSNTNDNGSAVCNAAVGYLNYLHGVNSQGMVYRSNVTKENLLKSFELIKYLSYRNLMNESDD